MVGETALLYRGGGLRKKGGVDPEVDSKVHTWGMGHAESGTAEIYRIGELAAETELSRDTLRYYERLGVIAQPRRSRGGFRLYGRDALEQIRFVKQAQSLGLALGEIRTLLSFSGTRAVARCRQVQPVLRARLREIDVRLADLRAFRRSLHKSLEDCERRLATDPDATCPVVTQLERGATRSRGSARGGVRPGHVTRVSYTDQKGENHEGRVVLFP